MKSARLVLACSLIIVLSHVPMNAGQQGQGGWGGGSGAWSNAGSSQSGQPGNTQTSYSYGGVDANGVPYGGYGGNGGYHVNITDDQGRQHVYSGGQGGFGGAAGQPDYGGSHSYAGQPGQPGQGGYGGAGGQPGQPGQPDYTGSHSYAGQPGHHGQPGFGNTYSYANGNVHNRGKTSSSSSAYASAWSTFYIISLFSLFLLIKT